MLSTACFVIRSSAEILPKVSQPQAVHRASYESFGLCSTTSIVGSLQSGQKVGRISITPPGESQYMTLLPSWRTTNNAERAARHSSIVVVRSIARSEQYRHLRVLSQAVFRSLGSGIQFMLPKRVARNRQQGALICGRLAAMGDEEDQETPLEEMEACRLDAKTAWVRLFIREASKRGYTIEDIVALLDEPGMTVEEAVEQTLSTRGPRPDYAEEYMKIARNPERVGNLPSIRAALKITQRPV